MSQSSHGVGGNAPSTNPLGKRLGESKHGASYDVAKDSEDVFLGPQPPATPTRERIGKSASTDTFARSPSGNERPNKRRGIDRVRSQIKTSTMPQPPPHPQRAEPDMMTHSEPGSPRVPNTYQAPGDPSIETNTFQAGTKIKVTQADLASALKKCVQMAANITTEVDDCFAVTPTKEVTEQLKMLTALLDPVSSPLFDDTGMDDDALEDADTPQYITSHYRPDPPPPDAARLTQLESAVTDMAKKFDNLWHVIVSGQTAKDSNAKAKANTDLDNAMATPPWAQIAQSNPPATSIATGPTYRPAAKPKTPPPPTPSFTSRHHDSRLIINISPTPSRENQAAHSGARIRDAINERLRTSPDTNHMRIGLVSWTNMGNAVINTANGLTAMELEPYADKFTDLLPHAPEAIFKIQPDTPWHKVAIHGVPTRGANYIHIDGMETDENSIPDPKMLLDELLSYNEWLKDRKLIGEPRWMAAPETLRANERASVVIAFSNKADADELVKRRCVFMYGHRAATKTYIDIPPLRHCTNCWKLDHTTAACKTKPRCRFCAGEHHTDQHGCNLCDSLGSTCDHTTTKCVHCPDSVSPHYADSYTCPYRRKYKGIAIATPRTNGGRVRKQTRPGNPQNKAPPNLTGNRQPPPYTPQVREGMRLTAKLNSPNATDEQLQAALDETNYDLPATFAALDRVLSRTKLIDNQPTAPSL